MTNKIEIFNSNRTKISVIDILKSVDEYFNVQKMNFTIQYLYGTKMKDDNYLLLEQSINDSSVGKVFNYQEIGMFLEQMSEIFELLLVVNPIEKKIKKYKRDSDLYKNNFLVIEYFDADYFEIYCNEAEFLVFLENQFGNNINA